ncbi:molecular chaperone DjiA [bacterium]|nr:molecular chaperone DjiA [bacterium]
MILHCGSILWGAIIGFALTGGNIIGGIVGGIIGGSLDGYASRRKQSNYSGSSFDSGKRIIAINSLTDLMMIIAGADNVYHEAEMASFISFMVNSGFTPQEMVMIRQRIEEFKRFPKEIDQVCRLVNSTFNYTMRLVILEMLFGVALADGSISDVELKKIRQAASLMGIRRDDYFRAKGQFIRGSYQGGSQSTYKKRTDFDPYAEFGLAPGASIAEIKSTYRKLVKKYHPDKVSHLGEEFRKRAEERMKRINQAYILLGGRN